MVIRSIQPIKIFFTQLRSAVESNSLPNSSYIIEKSQQLKLSPVDLLLGVLQPILYEIGNRYAQGKLTVFQEHQFSALADQIITRLSPNVTTIAPKNVDVLLVCCDTNYHYLGLRILELELRSQGVSVFSIFPSLPNAEIIKVAKNINPKLIGISVGLPRQIPQAEELIQELRKNSTIAFNPAIAIGGTGLREINKRQINDVDFVNNPENQNDFLDFIERLKKETLAKAG